MAVEIESPEEYGYENIKYNLSESSITDQPLGSLGLQIPDLKLLSNEHKGNTTLRSLIVKNHDNLTNDDVLITSAPSSYLVVVRPNYATNLETPRAIGCQISFIDLSFAADFQLDVAAIETAIKTNTKVLSITTPHNPTGTVISRTTLGKLISLTKERVIILLVDETYADISYQGCLPIAASLGDHVISVSSLSKSYGIPGIRLGWTINKNPKLWETFLAAKEQISISSSVVDKWIAEQVLLRKSVILGATIEEMRRRRDIVADWVKEEELVEWVRPEGGGVCFPRLKREPVGGMDAFYRRLLHRYGTYVGPRHWFEQPDSFMRNGYGWPAVEELRGGLGAISAALRDSN